MIVSYLEGTLYGHIFLNLVDSAVFSDLIKGQNPIISKSWALIFLYME